MIKRITRFLLLLQLAAAAAIVVAAAEFWHADAWTAAVLGVGTVLLFRLAITVNNFFLARVYRSATPAAHRIGPLRACRLFLGEFHATMLASSWTMPFRAFGTHDGGNSQNLPVLLIHGWGCNSGYWQPLSKRLRREGISHHAIDMEPVFGGIDDYVALIHSAVETLCRSTGRAQVILVAHSMGGLAVRAYLRAYGSVRVARVVTLGTPHYGTALANFGTGLNCAQMAWREGRPSDWLARLDQAEDPESRALFVSIYSHHDNIIAPQTSSHLPGADNVAFSGIGHVALARHPAVQARVIEEIRKAAKPAVTQAVKIA